MWIILGALLTFSAYGLDSFEKLKNTKILKVLPSNVVVLSKGAEDGIQRHDHAKLTTEALGYVARAICLKTGGDSSYWKLYRIPHAEAISKDYSYVMEGMSDREIPKELQSINETPLKLIETEEAPVQQDLPSSL